MALKVIHMEAPFVESIEEAEYEPMGSLTENEFLVLVSVDPEIYPDKPYIESEDILEVIHATIYEDEDGSIYYTDEDIEIPDNEVYAVVSTDLLADDAVNFDDSEDEDN